MGKELFFKAYSVLEGGLDTENEEVRTYMYVHTWYVRMYIAIL